LVAPLHCLEPLADVMRQLLPIHIGAFHVRRRVPHLPRNSRIALGSEIHVSAAAGANLPDSRHRARLAPLAHAALAQRVGGRHAPAAGARERGGDLSGAGARAEDVGEGSATSRSGGPENFEQTLARHPLLDLGPAPRVAALSDLDVLLFLGLLLL